MVSPFPKRSAMVGLILATLSIALLLLPGVADARGKKRGRAAFVPAHGKIFAGLSDTGQTSDYREYRDLTKAHPAVMQSFETWGYIPKEALGRWEDTRTRGMISLSTAACWGCDAVISSQSIAEGKGDRYILALSRALVQRKEPTYIRLFPEMNGYWNAYSAFHGNGKPRESPYSTKNFKKAWKRFALIVRGGRRAKIERRLKKLGMPKIKARTKRRLPSPRVAIAWVPQSQGSPNVKGNQPADYFPGYGYVDWVGADIYGKYPNLTGVNALYRKYTKAPFMIGEWSPWDRDDRRFVHSLFDWIEEHGRTRMAVYYQDFGEGQDNDFEVSDYPTSLKALRHRLNGKRFMPFAPENKRRKKRQS